MRILPFLVVDCCYVFFFLRRGLSCRAWVVVVVRNSPTGGL